MATDLGFAIGPADHIDIENSTNLQNYKMHRGRCWIEYVVSDNDGPLFDIFRVLNPNSKAFTYRKSVSSDYYCRIDYFFTSKNIAHRFIEDCYIINDTSIKHSIVKLVLNINELSIIPEEPPRFISNDKPNTEISNINEIEDNEIKETSRIPLCYHNEQCTLFKVKKKGKNLDRPFFCCKRPPGVFGDFDKKCKFFAWADDFSLAPKCHHNEHCKLHYVKKEGKNQGRWFYVCQRKVEDDRCNYFAWDNQLNSLLDF